MLFNVQKKFSGNKAVSPAISTVIMMGAMIAILSVTVVFANDFLWSSVAEGDFNSSKQLMHTVGLQIDDVAWTMGRTETIGYASQYGEVVFNPLALNYTITIDRDGVLPSYVISRVTGAVMFNFPTSRYNIKDGYWENISPTQNGYLTLKGTSAPVARVFAVEKVPMVDGSYIRVVVAPAVRVLNSSITTSDSTTNYVRMYLPILSVGETPRLSKSITLTGESLDARTISDVIGINVTVSFQDGSDFDSAFFNFPFDSENVSLPSGDVVLELYLSEVSVGFGINY